MELRLFIALGDEMGMANLTFLYVNKYKLDPETKITKRFRNPRA